MTRKDYVLIAQAIKTAKGRVQNNSFTPEMDKIDQLAGITYTEEVVAKALQSDNPLFNEEKFHEACEL